jgi:putative endonuclease
MDKGGFIYILTNKRLTVLYTGVTANLRRRIWEHEHHEVPASFTDQYNVCFLIYYEWFDNITTAIAREKQIKNWRREKKEALIATKNPNREFLNEEVYNEIYRLLY